MTYLIETPVHELLQRHMHDLNNPDARHRAVMSLFGQLDGDTPRKSNDILFRLDRPTTRPAYYLVRSQIIPDNKTPGTRVIAEKEPDCPVGAIITFRVAVNAIKRNTDNDSRKIKITSVSPDNVCQWAADKLSGCLEAFSVTYWNRETIGNKKKIVIDMFDGFAKVTNEQLLRKFLAEGVGRAKAYGCGLLTIRRVE